LTLTKINSYCLCNVYSIRYAKIIIIIIT
jgi:hypothetical protein